MERDEPVQVMNAIKVVEEMFRGNASARRLKLELSFSPWTCTNRIESYTVLLVDAQHPRRGHAGGIILPARPCIHSTDDHLTASVTIPRHRHLALREATRLLWRCGKQEINRNRTPTRA